MTRYAGAAIILICSLSAGFLLSAKAKQALAAAEKLFVAMKYIRDEITVNRTPTNIIMENLPVDGLLPGGGDVKSRFTELLKPLDGDMISAFTGFCESVGKSGADVQRGTLDAYISRFEALLAKRREDGKSSGRLYMALSLFFGVSAVIIFL